MKKLLILVPVLVLFCACALEVANVIGPAGGYVFYDKRNYSDGWRYIECSPVDAGEIEKYSGSIQSINERLNRFSYGQHTDWELPTESELKQMLRSFTWELTRFKDELKYVTADGTVYGCNFDNNAFGDVVRYNNFKGTVRIRPIRRF